MDNWPDAEKQKNKPILVLAVTSYMSMDFFKGQIDFLQRAGFDVVVICSPGWKKYEGVKYYPIAMEREISILKDVKSLYLLIKLFNNIRPAIVNAGTPKAGLLVGLAAFISRVPVRIYTCHGLRLETLTGWRQKILTATEKISAFCAHRVNCVSSSLRNKMTMLQLTAAEKTTVIGHGSCNGIDLKKYNKYQAHLNSYPSLIKKNIPQKAVFIGFIGRLTKDKGIYELVEAFEILKPKFPYLYLLLLGEFEDGDPVAENIRQKIIEDERIINLGYIDDAVPYYQLMKIVVLPTYREGLPTVLLEAGAMGIPVIASRATGCIDVVEDGDTGFLTPIGDSIALAKAVDKLLMNKRLASTMGQKARKRMEQLYRQETVWLNTVEFYKQLLDNSDSRLCGRDVVKAAMKRAFDLVLATSLLLILAPVLLLVALAVKWQMGSPIFFKQQRPGLHGKPFCIYKFRTMTDNRDVRGVLLPDEQRLTKLGAIIRKLSFDEFPQLINVIKGELSLVGPRPLLMKYLLLYNAEQARRHNVKPGITGWAQVNGRNAISWEEKFKLDIWYVDNRSFWLDVKIICMTVFKVLYRDGINQKGYINMPEFKGSMNYMK